MISMEEFLTVKEVAHRLQYSEETVKRKLRKGELPGHKIGGEWRVIPSELMQFLVDQKQQQSKKVE